MEKITKDKIKITKTIVEEYDRNELLKRKREIEKSLSIVPDQETLIELGRIDWEIQHEAIRNELEKINEILSNGE